MTTDESRPPPEYERPELPFERKASPWVRAGAWSAAGLEFGVAVGLLYYLGSWLDRRLGWTPWLSVVGALLGVCIGMYILLRPILRGGGGGGSVGG